MLSKLVRLSAAGITAASMALGAVVSVSAHEHRMVQGGFQMLVGWRDEPTFTANRNAVQLFLSDAQGQPVMDLGDTLQVQVVFAGQTSDSLSLKPAFGKTWGTPGEYDSAITPTRPGTYTFHFTGAIHGTAVDQAFTSSDKTFGNVNDGTAIEFPAKDPSTGDIANRVDRVSQRVDGVPSQIQAVQAAAQADVASARDTANRATVIGAVGVGLALLVLVINQVMMRRRRAVQVRAESVRDRKAA